MTTRVRTEHGIVQGAADGASFVFRNIPYAAAPIGPRRFQAPQVPDAWDGVRDASRPGVGAPQPPAPASDPWAAIYRPARTGDDCLTLEVWTPDPGRAGLPVIVHIHGGGYVTGSGSAPLHSGRAFARDGVVYVSINYRLGIEGFVPLEGGADNIGLRDQAAALGWVQRNIAAFGGDPDRVTILGQSGGGVSVLTQMAMPASRPLFAQGIAQSGSPVASTDWETAIAQTRRLAKHLKTAPTAEAFGEVPTERLMKAAGWLATRFALRLLRGDERPLIISPFQAVHGTDLLPESPLTGADATVPLLTGTARHETVGFVDALTSLGPINPIARRGMARALKLDPALRGAYANGPRALTRTDDLLEAAWTDWAFRIPTIRLLERRRQAGSWLYEFRWQAHAGERGAVHGIDLPFSGDVLDIIERLGPEARRLFDGAPQALATEMHGAFVGFAADGDPGWQPYTSADRRTRIFDQPSEVIDDAAGAERAAWQGRR